MITALDTNVLVYAEGWGDAGRCLKARDLIASMNPETIRLPVQVLGELATVLTRKAGLPRGEVERRVLDWLAAFEVIDTTAANFATALGLSRQHDLALWDALILSAADGAGCGALLTEDMQPGFAWRGLTVINPFQ